MFSRKTRGTYSADPSSTRWIAAALRNHNYIGEQIKSRLILVNTSCCSADKLRFLPPVFKNKSTSTEISSFSLYGVGNCSFARNK